MLEVEIELNLLKSGHGLERWKRSAASRTKIKDMG